MEQSQAFSSVDFIYDKLKGWILMGYLKPGMKIDQDECAEKLGVSRMPIRNALERLDIEKLVVKTPHRGVIVTPVSEEDLNNVYNLRAQLESMALILSMPSIDESTIEKLYAMLDLFESMASISISTVMEQNRSFHRALIQGCSNKPLISYVNSLWEQCERYRMIYFEKPRSNERVAAEHRELVHLIEQHKPQEASDFLIQHTRTSQKMLLATIGKEIKPLVFKPLILQ